MKNEMEVEINSLMKSSRFYKYCKVDTSQIEFLPYALYPNKPNSL